MQSPDLYKTEGFEFYNEMVSDAAEIRVNNNLSLAEIYRKYYNSLFNSLPYWKQNVILTCSNKDDRVIVEFAREVIAAAESEYEN